MASWDGGSGAFSYCTGAWSLERASTALEVVALDRRDEVPLHGTMAKLHL